MQTIPLIILPDEHDPEAAEVLVDGSVAGRPYRFMLDTGAATTCLTGDEFTASLPQVGEKTSSGVFAGGSDDLVRLPSIALGPIERADFTTARMPAGARGRRSLIGMDLLKDHSFHFIFSEDRLLVDPAGPPPGAALQELTLGKRFHPYISLSLGGSTTRAVWDTGAGVTVVNLGFIERHPEHFRPAGMSEGTDATGATMETPMYTLHGLTAGGCSFPPHQVAGVNLGPMISQASDPFDMILGYSTMRHADWWFDFPGRQWALTCTNGAA